MTILDRWLTAVLVTAGMAAAPRLPAQQAQAPVRPTRVPVTVALVDSLPAGAPFRILRRADATPRDVILLAAVASADDLSGAVKELLLMRRLQGDTARATGVMRVRRPQGGPPAQAQRYPWTARVLNDLRTAPRMPVSDLGMVPALEIWLPPQRGRAPAR
jgi:hypothetical protein